MSSAIVSIIDYGVGNTHSVANALLFLGYRIKITDNHKEIENSDVLILPGVGAFEFAINNIKSKKLDEILSFLVQDKSKPILGICLGMQIMATSSEENGKHSGLNWIPGKVVKLKQSNVLTVPHVGWNNIEITQRDPLFSRIENNSHYYFDHSYHYIPNKDSNISAVVKYGNNITAAIQSKNIAGVQFHPEKSQNNGLKLFRAFIEGIKEFA